MIRYLKLLVALSLAGSRYITEAARVEPAKTTACDFLQDLDGGILPTSSYYENDSYMLQQHKACLEDKSDAALRLKRRHDADTLYQLETSSRNHVNVGILGGSAMHECDPNWGSAVHMGYEFTNTGYNIFEGGGSGLMMAVRIGIDLYCRSLEELQYVIALMCEAKTATSERQQEIKNLITENYMTCQAANGYSIHGAFWMTRMPVAPYIGFGANRVELYSIYAALDIMSQIPNIWIAAPGSNGTVLEYVGASTQEAYKSYLSPKKQQKLILFNVPAWERSEKLHLQELQRSGIQRANTPEEVIEKTNTIVRETLCSKENSLQACSTLMYRQPSRIMEQEVVAEQLSNHI